MDKTIICPHRKRGKKCRKVPNAGLWRPGVSSQAGKLIAIIISNFMPLLIIDFTLILTLTTVKPVGTH